MRRTVAVYRHQLFKPSEVFITEQVRSYSRFEALFVGRSISGRQVDGVRCLTLQDATPVEVIRHVVLRDPEPFLARGLAKLRPALIHAHFGVEGVYALSLKRALKIPLVVTFHGYDATTSWWGLVGSGKPSWLNYALFRDQLARDGDLFICVSNYIREQVIALGFPEDRTVTHYIGVDTTRIQPKHVASEKQIVLHVARLVEKKGTEYLLRAFVHVVRLHSDAELVIVGDGPLRKRLESLTRCLGLHRYVRFLGAQPHETVMDLMARAWLVVLPSVTVRSGGGEGLGMVLLEAAAAGLPVVATRHGGIPEVVLDGQTGFLVSERDVSALSERILYLLRNEGLRRAMGDAARRMVEERFDLVVQTAKLEEMYECLL